MSDIAFGWWDLIVILLAMAFLGTLVGLLLSLKDSVLGPQCHASKNPRRTAPGLPHIAEETRTIKTPMKIAQVSQPPPKE
jgi:hypothetical protein